MAAGVRALRLRPAEQVRDGHAAGAAARGALVAAGPAGRAPRRVAAAAVLRRGGALRRGHRLGRADAHRRARVGIRVHRGRSRPDRRARGVVLPRQAPVAGEPDVRLPAVDDRLVGVVAVPVSGWPCSRSWPGCGRCGAARRGAAGRAALLLHRPRAGARLRQRVPVPLLVRGRSLPVPGEPRHHRPLAAAWPGSCDTRPRRPGGPRSRPSRSSSCRSACSRMRRAATTPMRRRCIARRSRATRRRGWRTTTWRSSCSGTRPSGPSNTSSRPCARIPPIRRRTTTGAWPFNCSRRFDEAATAHAEALRLEPTFAEAHNNRGTALQKLNRLPEAEAAYREALRLRPESLQARVNLGNVMLESGAPEEAIVALSRRARDRPGPRRRPLHARCGAGTHRPARRGGRAVPGDAAPAAVGGGRPPGARQRAVSRRRLRARGRGLRGGRPPRARLTRRPQQLRRGPRAPGPHRRGGRPVREAVRLAPDSAGARANLARVTRNGDELSDSG